MEFPWCVLLSGDCKSLENLGSWTQMWNFWGNGRGQVFLGSFWCHISLVHCAWVMRVQPFPALLKQLTTPTNNTYKEVRGAWKSKCDNNDILDIVKSFHVFVGFSCDWSKLVANSRKVLPSCLWLNKFPEGIRLCVVWPRWIWASSARCSTRRRLSGRRRSSSLARWSTRCTNRLKPASTRASTSDRSLHPKKEFRSANPILPIISLPKVVKLPKGEDFNDWLAVHVVDFFNRLDFYCQHHLKKCSIDLLSLFW